MKHPEQVSERLHWAIRRGELKLPSDEIEVIDLHRTDISRLLRLLFCLYHRTLARGRFGLARSILRVIRCSEDPFIPAILAGGCAEAPESRDEDPHLDIFGSRQCLDIEDVIDPPDRIDRSIPTDRTDA
jgi:hypothetical protein